jgi:hypothetical protein
MVLHVGKNKEKEMKKLPNTSGHILLFTTAVMLLQQRECGKKKSGAKHISFLLCREGGMASRRPQKAVNRL